MITGKTDTEILGEVLANLGHPNACCFWACDGPDARFASMKTCVVCASVQDLRKLKKRLDRTETTETTGELQLAPYTVHPVAASLHHHHRRTPHASQTRNAPHPPRCCPDPHRVRQHREHDRNPAGRRRHRIRRDRHPAPGLAALLL